MEKAFTLLLEALLAGGPTAIISLLVIFIIFLVWDRLKLVKSSKDLSTEYKDDLEIVLEKYHQGQINLIEAFNEIKIILAKLEGKL
jgi:uncharacterized membrane protein YccC